MGIAHSKRPRVANHTRGDARSTTSSKIEANFDWRNFWKDGDIREMMPPGTTVAEIGKLFVDCYKIMFNGNFKAPVNLKNGGKVLEVGCNHAFWATQIAQLYPKTQVTGIDYNDVYLAETDRRKRPPNFKFVHDNYIDSLPFPDESFDYVFYRPIATDIVRGFWVKVLPEMIRVTKLGGYVELLVGDFNLMNSGPKTEAMLRELSKLMEKQGSDARLIRKLSNLFESYPNLVFVQSSHSSMPLGWGGPMGDAGETLLKALFQPLLSIMLDPLQITSEQVPSYVESCMDECRQNKSYYNAHTVYGKRSQFS